MPTPDFVVVLAVTNGSTYERAYSETSLEFAIADILHFPYEDYGYYVEDYVLTIRHGSEV